MLATRKTLEPRRFRLLHWESEVPKGSAVSKLIVLSEVVMVLVVAY